MRRPKVIILDLDELLIDVSGGSRLVQYAKRFFWRTRSRTLYFLAELFDLAFKPHWPLRPGVWELIAWARRNDVVLLLDVERGARSALNVLLRVGLSPALFYAIQTRIRPFDIDIGQIFCCVRHVVTSAPKDSRDAFFALTLVLFSFMQECSISRGEMKERVLYVDDSPVGFVAAERIGCAFVGVPHRFSRPEDFPLTLDRARIKNNLFEVIAMLEALPV
ncbi:MAG: hypothetical protein HYS57_00800 [Parcubacteria group bacterium]|nr:hypothetical protein [Parcubacteria group bacterium]